MKKFKKKSYARSHGLFLGLLSKVKQNTWFEIVKGVEELIDTYVFSQRTLKAFQKNIWLCPTFWANHYSYFLTLLDESFQKLMS